MSDSRVQDHYGSSGIAAGILAALRSGHGPDVAITPAALAPVDHFHGRGLDATRDLVALLDPQAGEQILDIGRGIGGPARWIAAERNCVVTGIDLTPDFCAAGRKLTTACGLSDLTTPGDQSDGVLDRIGLAVHALGLTPAALLAQTPRIVNGTMPAQV